MSEAFLVDVSIFKGYACQHCYKMMYICPWRFFFILENSTDPDEMPPYVAFV